MDSFLLLLLGWPPYSSLASVASSTSPLLLFLILEYFCDSFAVLPICCLSSLLDHYQWSEFAFGFVGFATTGLQGKQPKENNGRGKEEEQKVSNREAVVAAAVAGSIVAVVASTAVEAPSKSTSSPVTTGALFIWYRATLVPPLRKLEKCPLLLEHRVYCSRIGRGRVSTGIHDADGLVQFVR